MTSSDRHASHNSPYRTGQHVPLPQSRHATLTSVATDAAESRTDLTANADSTQDLSKGSATQTVYQPGMRSSMQRQKSEDASGRGEIQMQNFSEGLPPAPPVGHSWKRIDRWVEDNYEELWDNLGGPCSQNDLNELEHELDCTLPMEVRESLQVHDGQERGGLPTGIIFGCMLLDCEEIVQEWKNWRKVNEDFLSRPTYTQTPQVPVKAFAGPSSSATSAEPAQQPPNSMWREELLARQDSQPTNAIQKMYTNPQWIPLARDWGGNCLAVDLAPGPAGKWGQVIIMGRDYDCKYVVARSWAAFLANVADDLSTSKVFVDEDTSELKLREFKQPGVEPAYLNILRWRVDQKYGRKGPRRRPANGEMRVNANLPVAPTRGSPYASPTTGDGDRGRSPQRFPGRNGATNSPRGTISSPLARVAEEAPAAVQIHSDTASRKNSTASERLLPTISRRDSEDVKSPLKLDSVIEAEMAEEAGKENRKASETGLGVKNLEVDEEGEADGMKTVEL